MNFISPILALAIFLGSGTFLYGQSPLFDSEEPLEIKLIVDLTRLIEERGEDAKDLDGLLIQNEGKANEFSCKLDVGIRGNFRRNPQNCDFPPLKFDFFRKKDPPQGAFMGQNKVKLVTHCEDSDHVLLEYLVYKLYNKISPHSYKVRLANVTYQDAKGNLPIMEEKGFFIEDDDRMAERIGGVGLVADTIYAEDANREALTTLYLFNFMIGNLDWDIPLLKNLEVVDMGGELAPIVVPYDFDFSEMVDAPYTQIFVSNLDRQKLRKLCRTPEEVEVAWNHFQSQKKEILDFYKKFRDLDPILKRRGVATLKDFYKMIKDLEELQAQFQEGCN